MRLSVGAKQEIAVPRHVRYERSNVRLPNLTLIA